MIGLRVWDNDLGWGTIVDENDEKFFLVWDKIPDVRFIVLKGGE